MRTIALSVVAALLIALPARAQFTARNLGGSCGGTIGYPAWGPVNIDFVVARPTCGNYQATSFPVVVAIGVREISFPVPFVSISTLSVVPGCTWHVADTIVELRGPVPLPATGAIVVPLWPAHLRPPQPVTVFVQALLTCAVNGRGAIEIAASDGWAVTVR